jgi:phospholipid/cholesterol/gamma-HCH transport system substrate-binding protein
VSKTADLVKVIAFVAILGVLTAGVGVAIGNFRFDDDTGYQAVFGDLSGLKKGDDVRAAGVTVGQVGDVSLQGDKTVLVSFTAAKTVPLSTTTRATVRYKNLTGDRFLDLTQGAGAAAPLAGGGKIPLSQTAPALDLDQLFNGFKPLLQGLDPNQVNQLSSSIISVFQGESGSVNSLLANVASVTSTLADRDKMIGDLIGNLDTVLSTVDSHRGEFSDLLVQLQQLVSGLAKDRTKIGDSLQRTSELASTATTFLQALRPEFQGAIDQTGRVANALNQAPDFVDYSLSQVPSLIQLTSRGGAYGSFFNFYLCGLQVKITGPDGQPVLLPRLYDTSTPRCSFQEGQ